jgi:hypothetical protein
MSTDRMEHFLARMSQDGVRDSSGIFTMSGEEALRKLAFNQLPRKSAWVLKIVQGAVAARASQVRVWQLGRSIQFQIAGADFGTFEQTIESWTSVTSKGTEAQNNLAVGLRAVCFASKRPCILVNHTTDHGYRAVIWDGSRLSRILSATELVKKKVPLSWVGNDGWAVCVFSVRGRRVRAEEFDELSRFAVTCPVPLEVDGREMNHFGIKDVSRDRRSVVFSAQTVKEGDLPARNGIRLPPNLGAGQMVQLAWVLYSDKEPQPSRLSWVRGGVVVEEQELSLGLESLFFRVFVPAEGLPTDLTTLIPRFPDPQSKEEWVRLALLAVKDDLSKDGRLAKQIAAELSEGGGQSNWAIAGAVMIAGILGAFFTKGISLIVSTGIACHEIGQGDGRGREAVAKVQALADAVKFFVEANYAEPA